MTTPADICRAALIQGGIVGLQQTIFAEDMIRAFDQLNGMIAQWDQTRFNLYRMLDLSVVTTGAQSYTIGPITGGDTPDIISPRPDKISSAYLRYLTGQNFDVPMTVIDSANDYASIAMKTITGPSVACYWDAAFPIGQLYVYPVSPSALYEVHVIIKQQISNFGALSDTISLPPEYQDAMTWNLALRLRSSYKLPADQAVTGMAMQAMGIVKGSNSQVGILRMPFGFGSNRCGATASYYFYTGGMG